MKFVKANIIHLVQRQTFNGQTARIRFLHREGILHTRKLVVLFSLPVKALFRTQMVDRYMTLIKDRWGGVGDLIRKASTNYYQGLPSYHAFVKRMQH